MSPEAVKVTANDDYTLTITFDNGEVKISDMKPYLDKGIFTELKDKEYFKKVKVDDMTVSWNNKQDICPDILYEDSIPYMRN